MTPRTTLVQSMNESAMTKNAGTKCPTALNILLIIVLEILVFLVA